MTRYKILAPGSKYNAHHNQLASLLGRKGARWPSQGLMPQQIPCVKEVSSDGHVVFTESTYVTVWVAPSAIKTADGRKSSTHRVTCLCPGCDRAMSAGRLFQHSCKGKQ